MHTLLCIINFLWNGDSVIHQDRVSRMAYHLALESLEDAVSIDMLCNINIFNCYWTISDLSRRHCIVKISNAEELSGLIQLACLLGTFDLLLGIELHVLSNSVDQ